MTRTRSEYRLAPLVVELPLPDLPVRRLVPSDRDPMAALMLDAYRGTIDDEGEDLDDAREAVDQTLSVVAADHTMVVTDGDRIVSIALAVVVNGMHYVDPIIVAGDRKRAGLGTETVRLLLGSLHDAGVEEVGAVITDGNLPSERLFRGLGFSRRGAWG